MFMKARIAPRAMALRHALPLIDRMRGGRTARTMTAPKVRRSATIVTGPYVANRPVATLAPICTDMAARMTRAPGGRSRRLRVTAR